MTVLYPEADKVQGNTSVVAVLTVADLDAAKLATEINAATSEHLSCFLRDWNPVVNLNTGQAPMRLCTTIQLPAEGNAVFEAQELRYVYKPQEADAHDGNAAKAALAPGTSLVLLIRKGLDSRETAWAVGDQYEAWPGRMGKVQDRTRSGDDEFAEYEIKQLFIPTQLPELDGVVVA